MQFRLLGNLEMSSAGGKRVPLPPKLRTILSLLLILHDQVVPVSRMIDELWPAEPPSSALATIQTYVYQLRRLLEKDASAGAALRTESSGYVLSVPAEHIDNVLFERCFQAGQKAFVEGDFEQSSNALKSALSMWRAAALADVPKGPFLDAYTAQLDEARLQAIELDVDADLQLGRVHDAARELKSLTAAHPLHEGFHAKLMVALHRLGRRHEALECYRSLRERLVGELGIEPSFSVQRLHRELLSGDPSFGQGSPDSAARSGRGTPEGLPRDIADFVGREAELGRLEGLVAEHRGTATGIITVTGTAGVGKTALVTRFAHRQRHRLPDGRFFANLRGGGEDPVSPSVVLDGFLRQIGVEHVPDTVTARSRLFRSWCADRRVLVILDDAADEEQIRPLLPGGAGCVVVVTTRGPLCGLDGATNVDIVPPPADEAVELLARTAGHGWERNEKALAASVAALCGNLPLAMRAIGRKLALGPLSLSALVARLTDRHRALNELACGEFDVRASLERSCRCLDGETHAALRVLSREVDSGFTAADVAPLLQLDLDGAEAFLVSAFDSRLLLTDGGQAVDNVRYMLPRLTRAYLLEQAPMKCDVS
ncbi:BTAD domain-containing putative transcriptional regulator [Amycolatopsis japonica]